jgi:hypothetical protein
MGNQGGLLQLVALGKQDVFLTGNPQIIFSQNFSFLQKKVYTSY